MEANASTQIVTRVRKNSREDIVFALGEFMGTRLATFAFTSPARRARTAPRQKASASRLSTFR
jgi:hypothetical protein